MSNPDTFYVYVLVRKDLPHPVQVVQSCHAMLAATSTFIGGEKIIHPHLVVCEVEDEDALKRAFVRLVDADIRCEAYHEDDLANQMTAVATAPIRGEKRQALRHYRLLR